MASKSFFLLLIVLTYVEGSPLKGISTIISPDLLYVLSSMGYGDEIVLADENFPSASISRSGPIKISADGHGIPELLEAILGLITLDTSVPAPVALMDPTPGDKAKGIKTPIWDTYKHIILSKENVKQVGVELIERSAFFERSKKAYAVVKTGETAPYGNIILTKGNLDH